MTRANILNEAVPANSDETIAESTALALADTDDIEEFPVLLASDDVRELIEAARRRGLSATGLARSLVRDFLRRTRGILLAESVASSQSRRR